MQSDLKAGPVGVGESLQPSGAIGDRFLGFVNGALGTCAVTGGGIVFSRVEKSKRRVEIGFNEVVLDVEPASTVPLTRHSNSSGWEPV
ncbi:MAG TPA: hypothetical protein VG675_05455 [Bryobacteraceae bacterium]|nr:hypothetical protein [Bryobacteraceae bacterium]